MKTHFRTILPLMFSPMLFALCWTIQSPAHAQSPVCDFSRTFQTSQCNCPCDCPVQTEPHDPPGATWHCYGDNCPGLSTDQLAAIANAVQELGFYGLIRDHDVILTSTPGNEILQQLRSIISQGRMDVSPNEQYFFFVPDSVGGYIGATGNLLMRSQ